MINFSLTSGSVQSIWKSALVVPLLKKTGLELTFNNFRPVSNLSLISKLGEKVVISQIPGHCREHAPLSSQQSAYRQHHSSETALFKVHNRSLWNMDKQKVTLLVLLDLSAAFDNINHVTMKVSEINFFRQAPTGDWNFFQSPSAHGMMWSLKSVNKIFPSQRNSNQNFWSPDGNFRSPMFVLRIRNDFSASER